MSSGRSEWLEVMTDAELTATAHELETRAEQFDAGTRMLVNDELRKRRMPLLGFGNSRY
jgi:hypothetical protein